MTGRALLFLLFVAFAPAAYGDRMTYEEAKQRMNPPPLPEFWVGDVADLPARWEQLRVGKCEVIATSPGGRPLHLITYGEREDMPRRANFNSAVGARNLADYLDKEAREKPVIFFVGPVHGHEVEALTGLVNLIQIMETGRDLTGRERGELRELGQRCRLLILPAGNPDGIARFEPRTAFGMTHAEFQFWGQGTWSDHRIAYWPDSKREHPRTESETGFLGCYFNDAGVNPMHDEFFAPMSTEAPAILKVAMQEGPDLAVSLHSHQAVPVLLRPAYVPLDEQQRVIALAEYCYELYDARGLPHGKPFTAQAEGGPRPASFNLTSALYHISGATSFTFECPHGIDDPRACQVTLEEILEIQLTLYQAMMQFALDAKAHQTDQHD
ncbi:MAG: hypothetical protein EA424_04115 [Planctomycetaceae bacterium]|nr:MAG: hypothetical protein EA424_04115 [Planctomycetaceae bacterium]